MCPYVKDNGYTSFPTCMKTGKVCQRMYRCSTKMKWWALESMERCSEREEEVPKGAYRVLFAKNGKIYVKIEDNAIPFSYKGETPKYVYAKKVKGVWKIVEE